MPKMNLPEKQPGDNLLVIALLFMLFIIIVLAFPACQQLARM